MSELTGATPRDMKLACRSRATIRQFIQQRRLTLRSAAAGLGRTSLGEFGHPLELYLLCRLLKPSIVIETGVASGMSSCVLLKALADNEMGKLISVDKAKLPLADSGNGVGPNGPEIDPVTLPPGKQPGWIIPRELRSRWDFLSGTSREILPRLRDLTDPIDLFLHDSDHSYENMMFEFEFAWSKLRNGGVLLVDNADWNSAPVDFARRVGSRVYVLRSPGFVGVRKETRDSLDHRPTSR